VIKVVGAKFKCAKLLGFIWFIWVISSYSKLIVWVVEGRKYAVVGGDQAFLLVVLW
jgi:hypothetical protein